jgi:putative heme-binding domain-containing protein
MFFLRSLPGAKVDDHRALRHNRIMMKYLLLCLPVLILLSTNLLHAETQPHGLRVPDGFEVTEFADNTLANDIYYMTLDPKGRVVVSGRGYIRLLVDDNDDGRADRALELAAAPKDGAMGLFWEGNDLFCMGDGGLRRYRDASGAGRERPPELIYPFRTGGEHSAHAMRRGPDGWFYVLCGNNSGITRKYATLPTSPILEPVAGCVLRFSPDFQGCEIVADGFRNAYAFDFNSAGDLFTFDSDNERCVSLPWYEPTRCYHVVSGGHYGWQNPQHADTWRMPPYFLDVVAPVATLGRGSPTGVVCYRHTQFPAKYRDGLFLCDWTFGRIYFLRLERRGSSYIAHPEVFLQATGENGFAPTAAAVHPLTGDLYVSIGGRGTRGSVYRIRYTKGRTGSHPRPENEPSSGRLRNPARPDAQEDWIKLATGDDLHERRSALDSIRRHLKRFTPEQRQRVIQANCTQMDRGLRQATAALLASLDEDERQHIPQPKGDPLAEITWGLSRPNLSVTRLLTDTRIAAEVRLDAVRIVQLALGDLLAPKAKGSVWEGYSRRRDDIPVTAEARAALRAAFPSGHADLDRELSRTLAMIEDGDPGTLARIAARLTDGSDPVEDIHYLIVLARLRAPRTEGITKRVASALLTLDAKAVRRHANRDTNWPLRLAEAHTELARKDAALNAALLAHPDFGRADHVLLTRCPGFDRGRAAEIFLTRSAADEDFAWSAEIVSLLGALPQERIAPLLRRLWGEHGVDDAILMLLARRPQEDDRDRFLSGLGSNRLDLVLRCLDAVEKLPPAEERGRTGNELLAVLLALRRLPEGKETEKVRHRLLSYLEHRTGRKLTTLASWLEWYGRTYPERAARLHDADGVDVAAWSKRLSGIDWSGGDGERGRLVFNKASCASCHSGTQALGPDLRGVTGRFSRADLFTAIVQPSKDVSPRYLTTQITTAAGKIYQGLIVYEAVDSVILQTGPAATIRLTNPQIRDRRLTNTSLMPAGLLDKLSDQELVDLYAYLKSLSTAPEQARTK